MRPRRDEHGQSAAEYLAVLALVSLVLIWLLTESGIGPLVRGLTAELVCQVLNAGCGPPPL